MTRMAIRIVLMLLVWAWPIQALGTIEILDRVELTPAENGHGPWGVAFDPTRAVAYVADLNTPAKITVIDGFDHSILTNIDLGGLYPHGIAYDWATDRIFVANYGTDNISIVDAGSSVETVLVGVGDGPLDVCVNSSTNKIYVTNMFDGAVSVIDGASNQVTAMIDVGDYPWDICVNEATNRIYTANVSSWDVTVIDGGTNEAIALIDVGSYPCGVCVNPATNLVYVTNRDDGTVSVIDGLTNTVIDLLIVGAKPQKIEVDPLENMIYVANSADDTLSVIDGSLDAVAATIEVGRNPTGGVAVDITSSEIYVANYDSDDISVVDGVGLEVTDTVRLSLSAGPVCMSPEQGRVYISNQWGNNIAIVDASSHEITGMTEVDYSPGPSCMSQSGDRLYVVEPNRDRLLILDGDGNIMHEADTGLSPSGVCVSEEKNRLYVSHFNGCEIRVHKADDGDLIDTIPLDFSSMDVAVNTETNMVYATMWMGVLVVIDAQTNTIVDQIYLHGFCEPNNVDVDEETNLVYVTALNCNLAWVVSGETNEILAGIVLADFPGEIKANPSLGRAYVCTGHVLSVIDENHTIAEEAETGHDVFGLAVNPLNSRIYATSSSDDVLVVLQDCIDADGDGYEDEACGGDDCDDTDPDVNPGMAGRDCSNTPDGVDNDCDGQIDEDACGCFIGLVT